MKFVPVEHMSGCCAVPPTSLALASESASPVCPVSFSPSHFLRKRRCARRAQRSSGRHFPTSPLRRLHLNGSAPRCSRRRPPAREPPHLPLRVPPPLPAIAPRDG
jgi:hypothetical protein